MTIPTGNDTGSGNSGAARNNGSGAGNTAASSTGGIQYANYANYVAQTLLAAQVGSVQSIPNTLASAELDTAILTDPVRIQAFRESIASQLNDKRGGGPAYEDLSERIADVIIDYTVQGAGTLEVHIIDPLWVIPTSGFIQADENGYLWPPIDINFPSDTKCFWTLCQYRPTWDATANQANLVLTFEDKIVSQLRQVSPGNGGLIQGSPNQTLSGFFQMLVDSANKILKPDPPITYVSLVSPQDPNYIPPVTQTPANASKNLRQTQKELKGIQSEMQRLLDETDHHMLSANPPWVKSTRISTIEHRLAKLMSEGKLPHLSSNPPWAQPPSQPGHILGPGNNPHFHG